MTLFGRFTTVLLRGVLISPQEGKLFVIAESLFVCRRNSRENVTRVVRETTKLVGGWQFERMAHNFRILKAAILVLNLDGGHLCLSK